MSERRYDDDETAAIFRVAAEGAATPLPQSPHEHGLTLTDLQAIGHEVGIAPDAVARAAKTMDVRVGASRRTVLGISVGVGRVVDLGRRMSDDEWERFVVRLREVFRARGAVRADGSLRQWTNGNLQVLLEPTATGHRVRFETVNGAARAAIRMGLGTLAAGALFAAISMVGGGLTHSLFPIGFIGAMGVAMVANGALRLRGWADRRASQMEMLAAEAASSPASPVELP